MIATAPAAGQGRWIDRVSTFVERHRVAVVLAVFGFYFWGTFAHAGFRPFWYDELYTWHIAQLPTVGSIWKALAGGMDQVPPLFFLLTRWSQDLLGPTEAGTRAPAVLGTALMAFCLLRFLEKRVGTACGLVAILFVWSTMAAFYSVEARPYGLLMGWCGLSLLCWQSAAESRDRTVWLIGLALSLAAAVATHFYACLLFVPIAAGEVVRSISRKKIDWPIWAAMTIGGLPYFAFLPILRGAHAVLEHYYASPRANNSIMFAYRDLLDTSAARAVVILAVAAFFLWKPSRRNDEQRAPGAPGHEIAALIALSLLPVVAWILAIAVTNAYLPRYVLPSVIGFGGLLALCVGASDRRLSSTLVLILGIWFAFTQGFDISTGYSAIDVANQVMARHALVTSHREADLPIAVADARDYFEITHYAPPEVNRRLVYLFDRAASLRYTGTDTNEVDFPLICKSAGLNCQPYRPYVASHPRFLVYRTFRDWLLPKLVNDGWTFTVSTAAGTTTLLRADSPGGHSAGAEVPKESPSR